MEPNPSVHFPPVFRRQQLALATTTSYLWPAPITFQDLLKKEFICCQDYSLKSNISWMIRRCLDEAQGKYVRNGRCIIFRILDAAAEMGVWPQNTNEVLWEEKWIGFAFLVLQAVSWRTRLLSKPPGDSVLIISMHNCYIFKVYAVFPNNGFLVSQVKFSERMPVKITGECIWRYLTFWQKGMIHTWVALTTNKSSLNLAHTTSNSLASRAFSAKLFFKHLKA